MKIIIFDFEIFRFDCLLGTIIVDKDKEQVYQTWDKEEIKKFYQEHKTDLWIGWNNENYDDVILETIINDKDPFQMSLKIVNERMKQKSNLDLISYDLMKALPKPTSLKLTELISGISIETTEVDFDLNRKLTDEEKRLTEHYNQADLKQTLYNFRKFEDKLKLRLDLITEFKLPLKSSLNVTGTKLAELVLDAHRIPGIENQLIPPKLYDTLDLKNEEMKRFFLEEDFRKGKSEVLNVCGAELSIGAGGLHSAIKKYYCEKALYCDVSGYYNLVMLNYDLLPRSISKKGKELYDYMYHQQLVLKKTNPVKRMAYKTILLSVFGAMNNEYCDFYDPQKALLVTITGQLFIIDLLEKLDGLVKVIQTNTDGVMLEPLDWNNESKIISIIESWEKRTGFVIKKEHIFNLFQRDVNCYCYVDDKGEIVTKGEAVKNYDISDSAYSSGGIFDCKEPPIIAQGIVNALINGVMPEDFVEKNKENLKLFQYSCKKNTYNYMIYEVIDVDNPGSIQNTKIESICRAFAYNSTKIRGMIYKHKEANGKHSIAKVSNLPPNVFIFNGDLNLKESYESLKDKIDYKYYVDRIYERLTEFIDS